MSRAFVPFTVVLISTLLAAQIPIPPSMEEVLRNLPRDPDTEFVTLALPSPPSLAGNTSSGSGLGDLGRRVPIYKLGRGVTAPRAIKAPDPQYSKEARKKGIEGQVVLWAVIGPDGLPRDIRVVRTLGYGLDEEAIKAVRKWRFKPTTKDGIPVAVQVNIEVNFRF